jgi:succinate dehydrogenase hydrophobic anchor subunit
VADPTEQRNHADDARERDNVFTEQRNQAMVEGVKGLFLMNGGGAVALLAFLQAIWKDQPEFAKYVVVALAVLGVGIFFAGRVQLFRYRASCHAQFGPRESYDDYHHRFQRAANISLWLFLVGLTIVVVGALRALF